MKKCIQCKIDKEITEYRKKGNTTQSKCKDCMKIADKEYYKNYINKNIGRKEELETARYEKIKEELWLIKSNPCIDCKNKYHPFCMDFDHLKDKTKNISDMLNSGCSLDAIKKEIEKCELVCSNCHRLRTYNRTQQGVAQPGRALRLERRGREIEARHLD